MRSIEEARADVEARAHRIRVHRRKAAGGAMSLFAAAMMGLVGFRSWSADLTTGTGLSPGERTASQGWHSGTSASVGTAQGPTSSGSGPVNSIIEDQTTPGWVLYTGGNALSPEDRAGSVKGYTHVGEAVVQPGKVKVYDRPGGVVIGYAYSMLGFVSLHDDAGFDAHALRVERFGCDQITDATCAKRLADELKRPGPIEPPLCTVASTDVTTEAGLAQPGHVAVDVVVRNTGSMPCSLFAGAVVGFYSLDGIAAPLVVHGSSPVSFVHVVPGGTARFAFDKLACSAGDDTKVASVELELDNSRVRPPVPAGVDLASCGRGDPGSTITFSIRT